MDFNGQKSTPYIADILHQQGIEHVIICPGSRNAPLTLAFARHGKFKCLSVIDERSAGYFALGLAQSTQNPVVLICTSGTAALNFAPAVAEAYYQNVPLIVITADRPESWIHQQDGQAIPQRNIYNGFIAASYFLKGELYHADDLWFTQRSINEAFGVAKSTSLPIHINCTFNEPLYNEDYSRIKANTIKFSMPLKSVDIIWAEILTGKNVMVILGQLPELPELDLILAAKKSLVCIGENLSNSQLVFYNASESRFFVKEKPDHIINIGGPIVSKQLKKYISSLDVPVIRVQTNDQIVDTFQNTKMIVKMDEVSAFRTLVHHCDMNPCDPEFYNNWMNSTSVAVEKRNAFVGAAAFSDFTVYNFIASSIPERSVIHLANSTPVRYAQIFNDLYKSCAFFSNRGTSGIDGSTSTAVGFAYASDRLNFLISGDLSFQYDANAFFNDHLKGNLKIIVINNSGGNIFRVIDGPRELAERNDFFETSRKHEFSNLAKHFKLNYQRVSSIQELSFAWPEFISISKKPSVLEIFTDAEISADTFKEFYKYLQQ